MQLYLGHFALSSTRLEDFVTRFRRKTRSHIRAKHKQLAKPRFRIAARTENSSQNTQLQLSDEKWIDATSARATHHIVV